MGAQEEDVTALPVQPVTYCIYDGNTIALGEHWMKGEGCDTIGCECYEGGGIACWYTDRCLGQKTVCSYSRGRHFPPGDMWTANDGCNACLCLETGQHICSKLECN